jgi:hypothetical protein
MRALLTLGGGHQQGRIDFVVIPGMNGNHVDK